MSLEQLEADQNLTDFSYKRVIDEICDLNWRNLDQEGLINVAWVYYFFSVQFRESF